MPTRLTLLAVWSVWPVRTKTVSPSVWCIRWSAVRYHFDVSTVPLICFTAAEADILHDS